MLWRSSAFVGLALLLVVASGASSVAGQEAPDPNSPIVTVAPVPPPAASIVVDAATGEVISANDERMPMLPASTTKLITALLVRQQLDLDQDISISQTATLAEPRRLGLQAGSRWGVEGLLYAALLCSCNDAAWALGQAAGGGSMAGYEGAVADLTETLGMEDDPVVRDPAGFDDARSVRGGNQLSARDLAIAARAYLADPELAAISAAPRHEWVGGDGLPHSVRNLNLFLGAYPGAIGLKTGATLAAGQNLVAAAERGGRTLIAVVFRSEARYAEAAALLDAGFVLVSADQVTDDVLPSVPDGLTGQPPAPATTAPSPTREPPEVPTPSSTPADGREVAAPVASSSPGSPSGGDGWAVAPVWVGGGAAVVLAGGGVAALARRRSSSQDIDRRPARPRRRDRRRRARSEAPAVR